MNLKYSLELVLMFLVPFIVVMIPILIGQKYGIYHIKKFPGLNDAPVGAVVGAAFGLLAFMVAFVFQISSNRYDTRKSLLLEEITNIRTTYLRAELLKEPVNSKTRKLLVEYVDIRANIGKDTAKLNYLIDRSQQILDTIWSYTVALNEEDRSSETYSLFTSSVNDLIDNYNQRITMTFEYRIPAVVLWIILIIAFCAMLALGYQFGISGRGNLGINALLAVMFSVVMFLIISLDRPETGLARLNQKPMITLQKQLKVMQSNINK
jgi:hypothetical protein